MCPLDRFQYETHPPRFNVPMRLGTCLIAFGLQLSVPHLVFPGGGIFFYWQAGVVTYLREQQYNLTATTCTGASAGSLTATLTATGVDFHKATDLALQQCADYQIWERGLQNLWGPLIAEWLDQLLPEDALEQVNGVVSVLITPVPQIFTKHKIDTFHSRDDLIAANLASVHLPWFMDGQPFYRKFRNRTYIDGSWGASLRDYHPSPEQKLVVIDHKQDPIYQKKPLWDFVKAVSPGSIYQMLEDGKVYAQQMEEKGMFEGLPKNNPP